MNLLSPITVLKGIGPKSSEKFHQLGIYTIKDLFLYYPFRYEDFKSKSVFDLVDGEKSVISGVVVTPPSVQYYGYKRNRLVFKIKQDEVVVQIVFFNQPYLVDKVELGSTLAIFGKWEAKKTTITGMKILAQVVDEMQPVYHVAKGITQKVLVGAIQSAFESGLLEQFEESLPEELRERYRLIGRQEAIASMHFPKDVVMYKQALRRLKFEEFFYFQLNLQRLKVSSKDVSNGLKITYDDFKVKKEIERLPFTLTAGQQASLDEILQDMSSPNHMNRLLQGDVGSGKTVVAALSMYAAYTAGYQSALMVPTEILAIQHADSLSQLFPNLQIRVLTSGSTAKEKKEVLADISDGVADMVIGTHALIQDSVSFKNLGFIITDEQHRFGVNQRKILREKGQNPDVLMMTATPIPRTLAITAFGDMDVSIIDELPSGRLPIVTKWVKHNQMDSVLNWIESEVKKGVQAYVVSPLIEESDALDLKNAIALYEELCQFFDGKAQVALMHGRMKNAEKDHVMTDFKENRIQILVSTTVIEVGVNVPNATIILVMDADRFGLSQLHQLRGRVGRGSKQSYAILVANPKTDSGKNRMKIMTETTNGFLLAEEDLKMRGSGEIFGTRQSGIPEFKVASIIDDFPILEEARKVASAIVANPNWMVDSKWEIVVQNLDDIQNLD